MSREEGAQDPVPADDRGFLYGDGLFETVIALRGRPVCLPLHLDRLRAGLERLQLDADTELLAAALRQQAADLSHPDEEAAVLRLTVSRGSGERGYAPRGARRVRWRIQRRALAHDPLAAGTPLTTRLSSIVLAEQPLLAGVKHCNRLEQVLAAGEAERGGVDDVLMCNSRGLLQCSSRANLFLLVDDRLYTPACDREGIAGTRRRLVIEHLAPALGLPVSLQSVTPAELAVVAGAFLCNSVLGIRAIGSCDGTELPVPAAIAALQRLYRDRVLACAEPC